mmetsp:Transcript_50982/g.122912  ORF Transcript_50982/g.122912 Transcript_50982/m.122912 type:complete len:563 (-) Transcript_50982:252-1940(-)
MKPTNQVEIHDAIIEGLDSMSDEDDEPWGDTGAFPGSTPSKSSRTLGLEEIPTERVFVNKKFRGTNESLEAVAEETRETTTASFQDSLMALSHSSSDTPSMNNTGSAASRELEKIQSKETKGTGVDPGSQGKNGSYPFNIYRSFSKDKQERLEAEEKHPRLLKKGSPLGATSPVMSSTLRHVVSSSLSNAFKDPNEKDQPDRSHFPVSLDPDPASEKSSAVISDEHPNQDYNQYLDDGGSNLPDHPQVMSILSNQRRKGGMSSSPASLLKYLFVGIEAERQMHRLAALHLRSINNWLLFLPSILLTLAAGIIVLVFEADLQTAPNAGVYASIAVGVSALISVFWQALSKQLGMGTRASLHEATSIALKRLSEDLFVTLSSSTAEAETIPSEYVALIGEKASQAIDSCCSSQVPVKLDAAFWAMSDRMVLMLHPPIGQTQTSRKCIVQNRLDFIRLYATAYDELSAEIINSIGFPIFLPTPRRVCDTALRNFKAIVTEGKDVEDQSRHCLKRFCSYIFGTGDDDRSLFDVLPAANTSAVRPGDENTPSRFTPVRPRTSGLNAF